MKKQVHFFNYKNILTLGLLLALLPFLNIKIAAQGGTAFGLKGGLTAGFQNWNSIERDPLFKYHGIFSIESLGEDEPFAFFAQVGYHTRGSAIRNRNFVNINTGQIFRPPAREFRFNNIALSLGAKRKYVLNNMNTYYLLGLRGEYTLNTNFDKFDEFNLANPIYSIYPFSEFVRNWNYGVIVGGGLEFMFADLMGGIIELTVNPDFSRQYEQPAIPNVTNPYTGNSVTIAERIIRNVTVELTVGFRFLRRVEYID